MRPYRFSSLATFALAVALLGLSPASPAPQLLYVANYLSNTVTEYALPLGARAAPLRALGGNRSGLRHPFGIALDNAGRLFVANSAGPGTIAIFAPHVAGNTAPVCVIGGARTGLAQPLWLAFNRAGELFVSDAGPPPYGRRASIRVFAPGGCGNIAPVRVISGNRTLLRVSGGLAFTPGGDLVVASSDGLTAAGSAGLVFAAGASGNVAPRVYGGAGSGLDVPFGIAAGQGSVGFWVTNIGNASVTAYAPTSRADLVPVRRIAGPHTGLAGGFVTGVTVDAQGSAYVSERFAAPIRDRIVVFASSSNGDAAPQAVIAGPRALLFGPGGIVTGPE